ncbi:MAG: NAD-glutamate dehydrogenase domain-containing protein [Phycisphaerales bacterium]
MHPANPTLAANPTTNAVPDPTVLASDLGRSFAQAAETMVPWFVSQMPRMYFEDTPPARVAAHLRAIIAAKASGQPFHLTIRSEDGREWTYFREGNRPGVLAEVVASLPMPPSLRAAQIHTSKDGNLIVDAFELGDREPFNPSNPAQAEKLRATIEWARTNATDWSEPAIRAYFAGCAAAYVLTLSPHRLNKHRKLFAAVSGTEGTAVETEPELAGELTRITIAYSNARTRTMLERVAQVMSRGQINIQRAYLDQVADPPHGSVSLLGFVIQTQDGRSVDTAGAAWKQLEHDITRVKWVDSESVELANRHAGMTIDEAELILGLCTLVHQRLVHRDRLLFSIERIVATAERAMPIVSDTGALFRARFDPKGAVADAEFATRAAAIRGRIGTKEDPDGTATILSSMLDAVESTFRTNYFLPRRFGLSLRLDPSFLRDDRRPELPYGTFFVFGRGFFGFHNRFKEIARGGLRVVKPATAAQHARERERVFDEVYGLSWAQQQKNKDIPEGGAKAAILLEHDADITRCVKSFVDSVLDLIVDDPAAKALVVDRFGTKELIYLGPDENITPAHIEWIVARARVRKYALPDAFMSSKPGAGINHKVYGVTSEGVNVFLEVALRARGIDPRKRPFTVTITGGPDGDVAGTMIRILNRDYGANARIVGIADGSGVGEDPEGLDHAELLRLFREALPIASFDPSKLSRKGRIVGVDSPEGAPLRNTLHNRLVTDAFVPGGGRPATINETNWRDYLTADGQPSSPIIGEGANLFLTPVARAELSRAGCLIFKDSSANKCGVICSSYEIGASMLLDEKSFLAIKAEFVEQVLEKLRELARAEAELLMAEGRRHPSVPLTELSTTLSKVINDAADAIRASMERWGPADRELARQIVREHLPAKLQETVGDRLWTGIPQAYLDWMVAKRLASGIVYREGTSFLQGIAPEAMASLSLRYLRKRDETRRLVDGLRQSNAPGAARAAELLARAGTRAALEDFD